jgi:hypothetical protein
MAHGVVCASSQFPMALKGQHQWRPNVLSPPTNRSSRQAGLHPAGLSWGSNSAGLLMHLVSPDLIIHHRAVDQISPLSIMSPHTKEH